MGKLVEPDDIAGNSTAARAIERTRARIIFLEASDNPEEADEERRTLAIMERAQRVKSGQQSR